MIGKWRPVYAPEDLTENIYTDAMSVALGVIVRCIIPGSVSAVYVPDAVLWEDTDHEGYVVVSRKP